MIVASCVLSAIGIAGAVDIALYHTLAHDLRRCADCRAELVTHALRGPTYALLFVLVPNASFHGVWFAALSALLAFDFCISVADFLLEHASRRRLGGLPTGEYLLHVVIAILYGALVAAVGFEGAASRHLPTALVWGQSEVPLALRWVLGVMALGVLISSLLDLRAVLRLSARERRAGVES
jgi:hypothetical protein